MKLNKRHIKKIFLVIIAVVLLLSIYLNTYLVLKYNVLPIKYLIVYSLIVGLIPIILIYFTIFRKLKRSTQNILMTIEIIYMIVLFVAFFYLNQTFNFLDVFTSEYDYETKNYYVLTLNESDYSDIEELENKDIGYAKNLDSSIANAIRELDKKIEFNHEEFDGLSESFNALDEQEIEAVLIIDSFYDTLIEDETNNVKDKYKIIYEFSIKEKIKKIVKDVDVTKETFNVYVSGIDSYGSVTDQTRSDVNIVMSINPKTNKILMINIPRDYYVELAGKNGKDKLTHAGIYGVETSLKTIENLLDIEINYYVKVNYNALIKLVDALDGVDVYSNYSFTSGKGYHFTKGYNKVNGDKALEFVRTRKAFLDGDRVRGENQQAIIEAVIAKSMNASILIKYDDILKALEGSFTTNISTDKIMSLINMQLDKMPKWNLESISLNGSDGSGFTFTYPTQELYIMLPNEETITSAKAAIAELK